MPPIRYPKRRRHRARDPLEPSKSAPEFRRKRAPHFSLPLPQRNSATGCVLVCGQGDMGQLGLGYNEKMFERKRPYLLSQTRSNNIVDICAGGVHSVLLTSKGDVFTFGCNDEGALGRVTENEEDQFVPKQVQLPGRAVRISAGDSHTACILEGGRVFAWGTFRDSNGNMGLTSRGNECEPISILPQKCCVAIASGIDHLVMLTQNGKVFTVGRGEDGQLGRVSSRSSTGSMRRRYLDMLRPGELFVRANVHFTQIWATCHGTFLRVHRSKKILACGMNCYKQLASVRQVDSLTVACPTELYDVQEIAGGEHHTLALTRNGKVKVIGSHHYGRLGLGKISECVKILTDVPLNNDRIVHIACGVSQSFAVGDCGRNLYAWGNGSLLQLGTGNDSDVLEPKLIQSEELKNRLVLKVASGGQHTLFLVSSKDETEAMEE